MKAHRIMTKGIVLAAALFASIPAQALAAEADGMIPGVIVARDGDNLVMRSDAGVVTNVTMNASTKLVETSGLPGFLGFRTNVPPAVLVRGLRINVEPESPGQKVVAKSIQFHTHDLETANAIQAALVFPQQQIQALTQELATQKQLNATQEQQIAAMGKRFGDLADYDLKGETNILFDVNSATLSDTAKSELKALAAKAKTLRGYLIQVAGYADAVGSAGRNQELSDRRAAAVVNYLQQECDVALSRVLTPIAMGVAKPVAPNETAQGRAENRRVTVKIAVNRGIAE
jgi:outer membrane protein OmpA-like peptidoglycan-associated protein